jgi:hypothetical protein
MTLSSTDLRKSSKHPLSLQTLPHFPWFHLSTRYLTLHCLLILSMYIILRCPEATITISDLLSPLYTTTMNLPPALQMTSSLIFLVSLLRCPTLTWEGGTSLVSPAQCLHCMVSRIMVIFSCYLYSQYSHSQYSWLSAGATSPTWRSDLWWYHATIATFNLESLCRCGSFCSLCIAWGKQCHTSKYFFLIIHALLIYIFRVLEERLMFW